MALWLLVLIIALPSAGFSGWLVLFALFLVISALYSLITGRPSWLGLPRRKSAGAAVGVGLVALIAGGMMLPATEPAPTAIAPFAEVNAAVTTSATPSPSPTPQYVLLEKCLDDGESVVEGSETFVCTLDDADVLVWMGEGDSQKLVAQRAEEKRVEVKRVADEKAAAQKAANDKAAAQKVAAEKAATEKAAAQEAAAAKAAAAETARVAAEQAAQKAAQQAEQEQAPAIQPLVEVPAPYYANCAEAKAAGVAPIYQNQPGYRAGLDRDKDGIACDK
ncbi:hypothetical protein AS189_00565 [Arthrobacter alpinus]|uniref:Excalibur calcium-binding domain-containing protein n=1 Tax=Arthrobacter alpinus TaxID=656366 RepID=A0A0S2LUV9_9MICC|nr:hypothetical protein AS189_00565 [Arthrobacter alpinus]